MSRLRPRKAKPGQESVWDYPRPPRLERTAQRVRVRFAGVWIADSHEAWRVLETSHPPTIYIPGADVRMAFLRHATGSSVCEWKGRASYFDVFSHGFEQARAAWTYLSPHPHYQQIAGYISFYPSRMEACFLDDEEVIAQPGDFYGGWITSRIVGPFKGIAGSWGW